MNPQLIAEYIPLYVDATWVTLYIAVVGIVLSLIIGLIISLIQVLRVPVLRQLVAIYVELSRNTPLLVQLFFIYYGLPKVGLVWSAETSAIVGLTFLGGSYMAEAFRSGFDALAPIQRESSLALGLSPVQTFRHVLLPQALGISFPGLTANVIFLIKETSVVSIVALADLMYVTKDLIGSDYNTWTALTLLVVFYLIILLPVSIIASLLEKKVRHGL